MYIVTSFISFTVITQEWKETFMVTVDGVNQGGLLCEFLGLRGFLPYSLLPPSLPKPEEQQYWDTNNAAALVSAITNNIS